MEYVNRISFYTALLMLASFGPSEPVQNSKPVAKAGCARRAAELTDFYVAIVRREIVPPDWEASTAAILVWSTDPVALWSNGREFKILTTSVTRQDVREQMTKLAASCELSADPQRAASQLSVRWKSSDITGTEFSELEQDFSRALADYVSYGPKAVTAFGDPHAIPMRLDTLDFTVKYRNGYQAISIELQNDPSWAGNKEMLNWMTTFKQAARRNTKLPIWPALD